uniref:Uncharacterized protein n=1 Tax=Panagrolaimus sp. ES5 TaxID=591445 RepID=A0AC34FVV1_9BILA
MDTSSSSFAAAKPKLINGKIVWAGGPSVRQNFALPYSIIYYMARNPSTPEVYLKLIQSCKFFFEKNPILVAAWMRDKTRICINAPVKCMENDRKCCIDIDLEKLSSKIWRTNNLKLSKENITIFNSLIYPKLYRCENIRLFGFSHKFMYDEFKSCASFLTDIHFGDGGIVMDDGSTVMLDKIFEDTPNIKTFKYASGDLSMINASTMKNICELKNLQHLETLILGNITDVLNIEDTASFIKGHPNTIILLHFGVEISEEYETQLNVLVDTIIESQVLKCLIKYDGQNEEKYKIMRKRYYH